MKTRTGKHAKISQTEAGFASIVVALVLILVLALLTVGFAQLARREQQTALNKQLANQAYYAAETGVNDAVRGIQAGIANPTSRYAITSSPTPNQCWGNLPGPAAGGINPVINSSAGVSYSCVLINLNPPQLNYSLADGDSRSLTFTPTGATGNIDLTITWKSSSTPAHTAIPTGPPSFLPYSQWKNGSGNGYPAVLQFSITPLGNGSSLTRNALISTTFNTYLFPGGSGTGGLAGVVTGGSVPYSPAPSAQGSITEANCSNASGVCSASITGIPYSAGDYYLVHLRGTYDSSDVTITDANSAVAGGALSFSGAQDEIDVTGKAHNVLKRIHVYVTPTGSGVTPASALQAQNICKRQQTDPSGTVFIDPSGVVQSGSSNSNPCNLEN